MYPDYSNKNMMCKDTLDGLKQKWLKQEFCWNLSLRCSFFTTDNVGGEGKSLLPTQCNLDINRQNLD